MDARGGWIDGLMDWWIGGLMGVERGGVPPRQRGILGAQASQGNSESLREQVFAGVSAFCEA